MGEGGGGGRERGGERGKRERRERRRKRKIRRKDFQISEVRKETTREIENRLEAAVRESLTLRTNWNLARPRATGQVRFKSR